MKWPRIPVSVGEHGLTDEELAELWHKLIVELLNEEFVNRTHQNRRTYDAGCKGPLCSKAVREHARRRNRTNSPNERYKFIDPILDYWAPIAAERINRVRAKLVEELTA